MPEPGIHGVRNDDGLTITIHLPADELPKHHPNNFRGAEMGLVQVGLHFARDTQQPRHLLRDLFRENKARREEADASAGGSAEGKEERRRCECENPERGLYVWRGDQTWLSCAQCDGRVRAFCPACDLDVNGCICELGVAKTGEGA